MELLLRIMMKITPTNQTWQWSMTQIYSASHKNRTLLKWEGYKAVMLITLNQNKTLIKLTPTIAQEIVLK